MTGLFFVDTNILVYARDKSESEKQPLAREWLQHLWKTQQGRISMQVLQEYYQVVTRRLQPGLKRDIAREDIRDLMAWSPVAIDRQVLEHAWAAEERFRLSWWDAYRRRSAAGRVSLPSDRRPSKRPGSGWLDHRRSIPHPGAYGIKGKNIRSHGAIQFVHLHPTTGQGRKFAPGLLFHTVRFTSFITPYAQVPQ